MAQVTSRNILTLPVGRHTVGDGLTLFVRSPLSRAWVFRYRFQGHRYDLSLGSANDLPLSAVKAKVVKLRALIAEGINPKELRAQQRYEDNVSVKTFAQVAEEAIALFANVRQWKNEKHAAQWLSTIRIHAFPVIGGKPINKIDRDDVLAILTPIWTEKTETASRVRGRIEAIFDYAISRQYCTDNPARWKANLDTFLPSASRIKDEKHFAAMPIGELKTLAPMLAESEYISYRAILFGILTASRAQEFLGAKWSEIDFETATWNLEIERTKTSVAHRVPLSRQALELLRALPRVDDLVFPSRMNKGAMSIDTPRLAIQKLTGKAYTMHGFRSTFRDWGEENFIHDTLLEKALSHSQKSKTVRAYQRSDLLEQRRPVMQQWADTLLP